MTKIFITGIAGFLGSHLADAMLADGHTVTGVDNLLGGYIDNVPIGVHRWYRGDCNEFDTLISFMKAWKPEIVFHCAATAYEGLSVFSPHLVQAWHDTELAIRRSTNMLSRNPKTPMALVRCVQSTCSEISEKLMDLNMLLQYLITSSAHDKSTTTPTET